VSGLYGTIVADPPWPGDWFPHSPGGRRRNFTRQPYKLMTIDDIIALPVSQLGSADANLFLWIPPQLNREGVGVRVARAWGFEPCSEIVWAKANLGMGRFPRLSHEMLLVCSRGGFTLTGPWDVHSVQRWRQFYGNKGGKSHSAKPEGAIDLIEAHSPGPYVELFARRHRFNWDVWGDQSANTASMEAAL
jgi:N6-adenosine-specific RNA methylase IME4